MEKEHFNDFEEINEFICSDRWNIGDKFFANGQLQAYRCERANLRKKPKKTDHYSENEILEYLDKAFRVDDREKLIRFYHIFMLKSTFEGSNISMTMRTDMSHENFERLESYQEFKTKFVDDPEIKELAEMWKGNSFFDTVYQALDKVVRPNECSIYRFSILYDKSPYKEQVNKEWFVFFFYNERMRRCVMFWWNWTPCLETSAASDGGNDEEDGGYDVGEDKETDDESCFCYEENDDTYLDSPSLKIPL